MAKALVVLSGGQDSTTALFWSKQKFEEVHAVTFDYGQRHVREINAAERVAHLAEVASHEVVTLGPILKSTSPLTDPTSQLEQYSNYEEMDKIIGSRVELTFVPMRNALFLVLAANRAVCLGISDLVTGVCEADNANYPDCRRTFIQSTKVMIELALDTGFMIHIPLISLPKADTVKLALTLPGCYNALAYSHTAYDGAYPPLGKDHATTLRAHGFEAAGVPDPLIVRAWHEQLMDLPHGPNYDVVRRGMFWDQYEVDFK